MLLAALVMLGYASWFTTSDNLPELQTIESRNFELTLATIAYTADGMELGRYGRVVAGCEPARIPQHYQSRQKHRTGGYG